MRYFISVLLLLDLATIAIGQSIDSSYEELDSLIYLNEDKGAYKEAIALLEIAKEKAQKEFGKLDTIFAQYTRHTAIIHMEGGQYDTAMDFALEAKDITQRVRGEAHLDYANALTLLAGIHLRKGNYQAALPLFIQVKDLIAEILGRTHPDFLGALNNLAVLYQNMGAYDKALSVYQESKKIYGESLDMEAPAYMALLHNLAILYKNMGNYEQALALETQNVNLKKRVLGDEHIEYANSLDNLASIYRRMGHYERALALFFQVKNISEKKYGKKHLEFAYALHSIAITYYRMEEYKNALKFATESKDLKEEILGDSHPKFANSIMILATICHHLHNYKEAIKFYHQSKGIYEKILGKEHFTVAKVLNNIGLVHQDNEDYQIALDFFLQSEEIKSKILGPNHPDLVRFKNNIAGLYRDMGDYAKSWELLEAIIANQSGLLTEFTFTEAWKDSLANAAYPSDRHIGVVLHALEITYHLLAEDSIVTAVASKQKRVADLAMALLTRVRNQVSSDQGKLRLLAKSNLWAQRSIATLDCKEDATKAFEIADCNKSVLLLQATKSESIYRLGGVPDSLIEQNKQDLDRRSKLQAKLAEKRSKIEKDSLIGVLNTVNQDIDGFVNLIEEKYPKYYQLKYQSIPTKVSALQALLDDKTALIEYMVEEDSIVHAFRIDNDAVQWVKCGISNQQLTTNIKAFHHTLSSYTSLLANERKAYKVYTEKAHWFYQKLLKPLLEDQKAVQNLIIVTDGELGNLPFETFLVEQAPQSITDYKELHYLVQDYRVSYNYSARLWKENQEAPVANNNAQIFGVAANYELALDSSMIEVRLPTDQWLRASLEPLPAARKEVETLQECYQGFFAFDTQASEKVIKEKVSNYAILHFATHGILNAEHPILSSLALSEDNDSLESNFWQAHEVSKMNLNADLVVLSACETGYGKFEQGNGIASLARSFMYAGAPALVVSLWQVNDQVTSIIMQSFYANLSQGMPKDESLRQAKLQYIKSAKGISAHPAFWSPFIMMGKTDAVELKIKGALLPWSIGIGLLGFLGIGGLFWRRNKAA